jgi:hypothetical protein
VTLLNAALLGVVQGLTEFLPISSTAHLLLGGRILGYADPGGVFTVMIQLGAVLAVMWLYRARIGGVVTGLGSDPEARRFAGMLLLAFLPALVAGALLVALALPADLDSVAVAELYEGLREPGVPVAGGDTTRAPVLVLTVTAVGRSERVPGRAGARPGDVLVVTGPLGGAAAGLHALREGLAGFDELVARQRRPPLRLEEGRRLARVAHAVVDLSDGIAGDAARIAERSGCRLVLEPDRIPRAPRLEEVGDLPFWTLGEDYELLAAVAPADAATLGFPVVGRCEEGEGVEPEGLGGWDSFGVSD